MSSEQVVSILGASLRTIIIIVVYFLIIIIKRKPISEKAANTIGLSFFSVIMFTPLAISILFDTLTMFYITIDIIFGAVTGYLAYYLALKTNKRKMKKQ